MPVVRPVPDPVTTYRIVSAAPDTKMTVVESIGDKPVTFKIPLVPSDLPATKSAAKKTRKNAAPEKEDDEPEQPTLF